MDYSMINHGSRWAVLIALLTIYGCIAEHAPAELPANAVTKDTVTGDDYLQLSVLDEEQVAAVGLDAHSYAPDPLDRALEAMMQDPDTGAIRLGLFQAIADQDQDGFEHLVESLPPEVAARHAWTDIWDAQPVLVPAETGQTDHPTPTSQIASKAYALGTGDYHLFRGSHGTDYTFYCSNSSVTRCNSRLHFPCNGTHTNGTYYRYVCLLGVCKGTMTVTDAVLCHGRQDSLRRQCKGGGVMCGAGGTRTGGAWKKQKLLHLGSWIKVAPKN